jgi:hypothetical protein
MIRNLPKRLERLEACLKPRAARVLKILVTRVGEPDEVVELVLPAPNRRRLFWQAVGESER